MNARRWTSAIAVALLVLFVSGPYWRDYSALAFGLGPCILIYFALLILYPAAARLWLCLGGAIAGGMILGGVIFMALGQFRDGWNLFGVMLWSGPVLFIIGGVAGFWMTRKLTEPDESSEQQFRT
jgi:hypothetical protein